MLNKKIVIITIIIGIVTQSHFWGAANQTGPNKQAITADLKSLLDSFTCTKHTHQSLFLHNTPDQKSTTALPTPADKSTTTTLELNQKFMTAILDNDQPTIDSCLQSKKLDINFADSRWGLFTPLLLAIQSRAITTIQKILHAKKHTADPDKASQWGDTPLAMAAMLGYAEIAELLLDAGATIDLQYPQYGRRTALWEAINNDRVQTAQLLIDHGATVLSTMQEKLIRLYIRLEPSTNPS